MPEGDIKEKQVVITDVSEKDIGVYHITTITDDEGGTYQTFSKSLGQWLKDKKYPTPARIKFRTKKNLGRDGVTVFYNRTLTDDGVEGYTPPPRAYGGGAGEVFTAEQKARVVALPCATTLLGLKMITLPNLFVYVQAVADFILKGVKSDPGLKEDTAKPEQTESKGMLGEAEEEAFRLEQETGQEEMNE